MTDLRGRTALVTGGGSGLGAAIASAIHSAGADVVVVGRDEAKLGAVVVHLGERARGVACDVSDPASVESLRAQLADTEVSILVNNAGVPGPVAFVSQSFSRPVLAFTTITSTVFVFSWFISERTLHPPSSSVSPAWRLTGRP